MEVRCSGAADLPRRSFPSQETWNLKTLYLQASGVALLHGPGLVQRAGGEGAGMMIPSAHSFI